MKPISPEQRAYEAGARASEIVEYLTKKWYTLMNETNLYLVHHGKGKKPWSVYDTTAPETPFDKPLKKGSMEQCVDFMLEKWIESKCKHSA